MTRRRIAAIAALAWLLAAAPARAGIAVTDKISDVRGTRHNLSAAADGAATPSGGTVPVRAVKAAAETQVCVFCHTPHEAESAPGAPLWNRKVSGQTYTPYSSSSMEADAAEMAAAPGGSSKLCLSCHDGTMAIDKVNALNGAKNATIPMSSTTPVKMPSGAATTGFTRDLGTDLSADHPISFTYNAALAAYDGELRGPDGAIVGNRVSGATPPKMPLENGQMQCATCHDPHLRDKSASNGNAKFLRMNRFQVQQPSGGGFSPASDIICLACHAKGGISWAYSAHANNQVATQTYTPAAAQQREFPSTLDAPGNANPPVWQVACLNCHDTHTTQGARRLLREGTDSTATPKAGGAAALEETCYQCHTASASSAVSYSALSSTAVPDIKTEFGLARHMPIKSADQASGTVEVHDIGGVFNDNLDANCSKTNGNCGKDLIESRSRLGVAALGNRHAECSDCHNPHRVVKFRDFRGNPAGTITGAPDPAGTHPHTDSAMNHTNIASGVLRGSWGVEPNYGAAAFDAMPSSYTVKRGDPGANASALIGSPYVTREYQICLKCHSDYGYSDNNLPQTSAGGGSGNRPTLGSFGGGTPSSTNGATMYTNQAREFQAPAGHEGPATNACNNAGTAAGAGAAWNACNQRSWHPVIKPTGRSTATRGMSGGNPWLPPWNNQVGANTMYCSDCHGSNTSSATSVIPDNGDNGKPWGPHGSSNDFILKGAWTNTTGGDANLLCFKCHDKANYTSSNDTGKKSGFYDGSSGKGNLHNYHVDRLGKELRCTWCHVAVPHGWKNKALLVNLRDLGPEVGLAPGTAAPAGAYTNGPYYYKAVLRVTSFAKSGAWSDSNCGGKDYMRDTMCASPP